VLKLCVKLRRLSTIGDRAFPVAAARTRNSLPAEVTSSNSLQTFKTKLKSHLILASFSVVSKLLYSVCKVSEVLRYFFHFKFRVMYWCRCCWCWWCRVTKRMLVSSTRGSLARLQSTLQTTVHSAKVPTESLPYVPYMSLLNVRLFRAGL